MSTQLSLLNSETLPCLITALLLCAFSSGCAPGKQDMPISDLQFRTINKQQAMHYAYSGDVNKQGVLFIHGTPGGWSAFADFLNNKELQQQFYIVSVDRLNWGKSERQQAFDFDSQADAINLVMQNYPNKKWIIVGHSLGASIAPKIALKNPDSVTALILLAGTLSPELGKPRWYNHVANNFLINWLIPNNLKKANLEIMALEMQLSILQEEFISTQLDSHVVVIQGMKDKLVSPQNTQFMANHWGANFTNLSIIELDQEGHFLPWRQTELITEQIRQLSNN